MSRKFIDVTQLVNWQGKLTGIPRVMQELSLRFSDDESCTFVVWDDSQKKFVIIGTEFLHVDRSGQKPAEVIELVQPGRALRLAQKVRQKSKIVRKSTDLVKKIQFSSVVQPNNISATPTSVIFNKGDVVLVTWGDWHNTEYINYLISLPVRGVQLMQIAYDMLPLVTPQYSGHSTESLAQYCKAIYPLCDVIFAISEHTKQDVANWLKSQELAVPKIVVVRLGDDFQFAQPQKPEHSLFDKKNPEYLLCVGTIEARKNHALLYYVYKLAKQRRIVLPNIVIVGRRGWKTDDVYELIVTDPDTKDSFVFLHNANDEELSWLYSNCLFSVYPSFYEGWGLPIAESIARGVPCTCSNTSSMPEVAGNLITYFSPASTDECLESLQRLLQPKELKEARIKLKQYAPTSWDDTFETVNKAIGDVL